jgi:Co/Zn/Cd efflux system component
MSASCCHHGPPPASNESAVHRRVLWTVLAVNAAMFLIEIGAGLAAGSASLQADALDFFGDAANYAVSLFVVGMALRYRALAAFAKGATMGAFGLWVIGTVVWHALHGTLPNAVTMGAVGFAALAANAASFGLLWAYRRRRQYAVGVDLHAQRRAGQPRGADGRAWRVRHRHRVAGHDRGRHHGRARPAGGSRRAPSVVAELRQTQGLALARSAPR